MDFAYPPEVNAFRAEFKAYLDSMVTPELMDEVRSRGESGIPLTKDLWRKLGAKGYFGLGWPQKYGGEGKSPLYWYVINYETAYRGLPVPHLTLYSVAPALMRIGSDEQKGQFLPKILRGEMEFAIGYTEPEAGSDLASLKTRAVRDGDYYVINGQKIFTSWAHHADYVWLAVRTDQEAPKHRGISLLMVPLNSEGIEMHPIYTIADARLNIVSYNNVRVPVSARVGEENRGWYYITTQLDLERAVVSAVPHVERVFDWLCQTFREKGLGPDAEWTRVTLAHMAADLNMLKVMDMKTWSIIANEEVPVYEASMIKMLSIELRAKLCHGTEQMVNIAALIRRGSPGARLDSSSDTIERQFREAVTYMIGGGSNDIQPDLMATHGLHLPR
jgi:alkylation response protein AidB-like acyl-CoA dehydrogenase